MIRFPSSLLTISMEASGFVVAAAQRFQRQGRELATQIGTRTRERIRGLEEGWGRLNKMPDPDRRVPLENADIGLLSAQIFTAPSTGYRLFEEIAGRGVALAGALFVYFPLTPIIALAIKLDSRGPVFYRQARLGLGGVPFEILKFRTMHMTHTTPVPIPPASEITRVGRFLRQYRINELPQLLHVLSGRMALIGPRPDISAVMEIYRSISPAAELRLAVKPGLTGWAKVNHGRLGDRACNLEYDLYWLGHRSIPLGLEILFRTVRVVLTGHGGG